MKKKVLLTTTVIAVLAICASGLLLLPNVKEKKIKDAVAVGLTQKMAPRLTKDEDLQSLYEEVVAEMDEEQKIRYDLLEEHYKHSEISTISINDETIELQITTPDLAQIVRDYKDSGVENITTMDFKQELYDNLAEGNFKTVTNIVSVGYTYEDNGSLTIDETFEYLDAIYGGLPSLYIEYNNVLMEAMENAG